MRLKENEILRCPKCGGKRFNSTAHVTQDWEMNENGTLTKIMDACVEVTHYPGSNDIWDCTTCGYSGLGSDFITEK